MCQVLRGRRDINEHVKSSEPDKQYDAWLFFFFSLYMYLSYIFYFKESTIVTTEKQKKQKNKNKTNTKKNIQKYGGQVASSSIWLCPFNKTKFFFFFFFQLVLKLHPYLLAPLQLKGGNLLVLHICFLIYFFSSLLLAKNKSFSSSSLKWIYKFKQMFSAETGC